MTNKFSFFPEIEKLCKQESGKLWFHIELYDGIRTENVSQEAGVLQLKGNAVNKKEFINEFKKRFKCNTEERFASTIKGGSFLVVARKLINRELVFDELSRILSSFVGRFGTFMY